MGLVDLVERARRFSIQAEIEMPNYDHEVVVLLCEELARIRELCEVHRQHARIAEEALEIATEELEKLRSGRET